MTDFQNSFLNIICTSVKGDIREMSNKFDFDLVFDFCKKHNIVTVIYYGAIRCISVAGYNCCEDYYKHTCDLLTLEAKQSSAAAKLKSAFLNNGIDFIQCGKAVFKKLYKYPEMCVTGRVVFAVKKEQYDLAIKSAEACGFIKDSQNLETALFEAVDGTKVVISCHPNELKKLPADNKSDIWENAVAVSAHEFEMLPEFAFYCNFIKLADAYIDGKLKISNMIDIYLLKNTCSKQGLEDVAQRLESVGLEEFYINVMNLLRAWFENLYPDVLTNIMTNRIFDSDGTLDDAIHKLSLKYKLKKVLFSHRSLKMAKSELPAQSNTQTEMESVGLEKYLSIR